MTELRYQLHWARSNLKAFGAINNSERGVWTMPGVLDNCGGCHEKYKAKQQ